MRLITVEFSQWNFYKLYNTMYYKTVIGSITNPDRFYKSTLALSKSSIKIAKLCMSFYEHWREEDLRIVCYYVL